MAVFDRLKYLIKRIIGVNKIFAVFRKRKSNTDKLNNIQELNTSLILNFFLKYLKISVVFFLLIIIGLAYLSVKYYLYNSEKFNIKSIKIAGAEHIGAEKIEALYLNYCKEKNISPNSNIFKFNISQLHSYLLANCKEIEELYISQTFDNSLLINITERKPIGIVLTTTDKIKLIDSAMNTFETNDTKQYNLFLLTTDNKFDEKDNTKNAEYMKLLKFAKLTPAYLNNEISEIYDTTTAIIIYFNSGYKIYCDMDFFDARFQQLNKIISVIPPEKIEYIDFRFKEIYLKYKEKRGKKNV